VDVDECPAALHLLVNSDRSAAWRRTRGKRLVSSDSRHAWRRCTGCGRAERSIGTPRQTVTGMALLFGSRRAPTTRCSRQDRVRGPICGQVAYGRS
jgi:hypothetical protein